MRLRRLSMAALVAFAGALPVAASADAAAADSLDRAVAVFVASNMKIAVDNALVQLSSTGVQCDTAKVKRLIFEELARPYDRAAHDAANATIERIMDAKARAASDAMLARAAAAPGVTVLPDGLVIETLQEGDTAVASPTASSLVALRYTGMLPDGSVFDAISPQEAPLESRAGDLTPGMSEALTHMHPGGRYRVTMPAALGYGEEGVQGVIPSGCALQFDIELVKILQ